MFMPKILRMGRVRGFSPHMAKMLLCLGFLVVRCICDLKLGGFIVSILIMQVFFT